MDKANFKNQGLVPYYIYKESGIFFYFLKLILTEHKKICIIFMV